MARAGPSPHRSRLTHPTAALGEAVGSLTAAALVCAASPKKKAVHRLRTWTRRVEARLELIAMLREVPAAARERREATGILKKLRRAAGVVRDLDVEGELVLAESRRGKGRTPAATAMRKEAREFRVDLREQRDRAAKELVRLLEKKRKKLPLALRELSKAFEGTEETALAETRLVGLVEEWFGQSTVPRRLGAEEQNEALHAVRKRAKLARYMLEIGGPKSGGAGKRAGRVAARFEALQHAGGEWHDWMQLSSVAAKRLGKASPLAGRFSARAERALKAYQRRLTQLARA